MRKRDNKMSNKAGYKKKGKGKRKKARKKVQIWLMCMCEKQKNAASLCFLNAGNLLLSHPHAKTAKARFRRRSFHEPNLFRIKADQTDFDRLS